jgi:hypothetical protein
MAKFLEHRDKYVGLSYQRYAGKKRGLRMSDVFPATTDDERDPREDQSDDRKREAEIKGDKPPHHDD